NTTDEELARDVDRDDAEHRDVPFVLGVEDLHDRVASLYGSELRRVEGDALAEELLQDRGQLLPGCWPRCGETADERGADDPSFPVRTHAPLWRRAAPCPSFSIAEWLLLTREHCAPPPVQRHPCEMILIEHAQNGRLDQPLAGARARPGRDGTEGDERFGGVQGPRHEFWCRPAIVHGAAEEPVASGVEPEHPLALHRGVIELLGPLQAQVVEQRLHHTRSRRVGHTVEVAGEPHLEPPGPNQSAEHAAGWLRVSWLERCRRLRVGRPIEALATLRGEALRGSRPNGEATQRGRDISPAV